VSDSVGKSFETDIYIHTYILLLSVATHLQTQEEALGILVHNRSMVYCVGSCVTLITLLH
jgi:hypothetical protein